MVIPEFHQPFSTLATAVLRISLATLTNTITDGVKGMRSVISDPWVSPDPAFIPARRGSIFASSPPKPRANLSSFLSLPLPLFLVFPSYDIYDGAEFNAYALPYLRGPSFCKSSACLTFVPFTKQLCLAILSMYLLLLAPEFYSADIISLSGPDLAIFLFFSF